MKKILMVIGVVVVGLVVLGTVIFIFVYATSKKMVCKSDEGNITLMYNDKTITGYTSEDLSYDLDEQKEYAEQIGVEDYLDEFKNWFESNTTGSCSK